METKNWSKESEHVTRTEEDWPSLHFCLKPNTEEEMLADRWMQGWMFVGISQSRFVEPCSPVDENALVLKPELSWDSQKDYLGPESWDQF